MSSMAVPLQVAHQGEVQDADGPVTGTLEFVFELFDAASEGNEVWSETRDVDVVDGNYAVLLGSVTAIDSVLFVEPALWLQITIEGGDPLLPRQPIASAPYAIVAGTAENVSGGTVDASSIAVNGLSVVNSTGQWVGPSGSVDWSAITGAPSDADTLGGLSCADGDRAVWSDSSQLWECGSATVTLDRLDTSVATSGQVLTYDGAQTAWEDPVIAANSPCSLTTLNEPLSYAEVDCGGIPVFMRTWRSFSQVDAGGNHACGINSSGLVQCWGANTSNQSTPPGGTFTQVSAGYDHACAISTSGSVQCWGDNASNQSTPPGGAFTQVSAGWYHTCGIDSGGSVQCWGQDNNGQSTPPAGAFTQVSAGKFHTCGIGSAGSVQCWGYNAQGQSTEPAGTFTQVSAGDYHTCGINSGGSVQCWGGYGYGEASPPSGAFTQVSAGSNHTCGIDSSGSVQCWGDNTYNQSTPPQGTFTEVSAGSDHTCGTIQSGGLVICWGSNAQGQTSPP